MKKILFPAIIAATMFGTVGCIQQKGKGNQNKSLQDPTTIQYVCDSTGIFGTYIGTFPCADCGGKDISITINKDGTYILKYKYQDKDGQLVEECGVYSILDKSLIETTTPSSGEKTYYKFLNGNLVLSDSLGTVNKGELAKFYILKRSNH